jgi:hypothetical protein
VELARRLTRTAGQADPVGQYVTALNKGDTEALETGWPGEVVVYDPHAGEIRGHKHLRRFVRESQALLAERRTRTETIASTVAGNRAVLELLARLSVDGRERAWPVAVVAESPDDGSVVFRSYFSRWLFDGRRPLRSAILESESAYPDSVVGRYQTALDAGDTVPGTYRAILRPQGCK